MTRKHFEFMADMVRAILAGEWTDSAPVWADESRYPLTESLDLDALNYRRAVQTAEAFILLAESQNPRVNRARFLRACGLEANRP